MKTAAPVDAGFSGIEKYLFATSRVVVSQTCGVVVSQTCGVVVSQHQLPTEYCGGRGN
jgi:hypothetical protein